MENLSLSKRAALLGLIVFCCVPVNEMNGSGKETVEKTVGGETIINIHEVVKPTNEIFLRRMFGNKVVDYGPKVAFFAGLGILSGIIDVPFVRRKTRDKLFKVGVLAGLGYYLFWGDSKIDRIDKTTVDTNERVKNIEDGETNWQQGVNGKLSCISGGLYEVGDRLCGQGTLLRKIENNVLILDKKVDNIHADLKTLAGKVDISLKDLKSGQAVVLGNQKKMGEKLDLLADGTNTVIENQKKTHNGLNRSNYLQSAFFQKKAPNFFAKTIGSYSNMIVGVSPIQSFK